MPALIFALGMYLPLELNTPALVGGIISHFVLRKSERTGGAAGRTMRERAVVIASGLMAGGALGGVFGAALRLFRWYREDLVRTPFYGNDAVSQGVSIVLLRRPLPLSLDRLDPKGPGGLNMSSRARRRDRRRAPRNRHALGRRRHEPVRDRPLHRRLLVLGRAAARRVHAPDGRARSARPAASAAKTPDRAAIEAYLAAVDVQGRDRARDRRRRARSAACAARTSKASASAARSCGTSRWRSSGKGPEVPYERCVKTITGAPPEPSQPEEKRRRVRRPPEGRRARLERLATRSSPPSTPGASERLVPGKSIPALGDAFIARYDALTGEEPPSAPAARSSRACRAPT